MSDWQQHFQLQKYDPFTGEFIAVAAMGKVVDRAKERLDYPGSKPYFQKWSDSQYEASGGKSYGNVRLQHDPKRPAGILYKAPEYNDDEQTIRVFGKAVDPVTKELMQSGALTGVSIGGSYVKKTLNPKDGVTDYIASPQEISVVDRPCLAQATFEVVKNEQGETELRKFASEEDSASLIKKLLTPSTEDTELAEKSFTELNTKLDALTKSVSDFIQLKAATEKSDFVNPTTDEVKKNMATPTVEELQKAHKSVMDRLADCKKAASDHRAEMHKAASDHEAAMHEACDNCAKALGGTVPMEVTKTEEKVDLKKEDKTVKTDDKKVEKTETVTDEQIAAIVTATLQKAMGIEEKKEVVLTLEERIAKAVEASIAPLMKADPKQARPRFVEKSTDSTVTEEERAKLAKAARGGDREAVLKLMSASSAKQVEQMVN
jgi:hypothetical protein